MFNLFAKFQKKSDVFEFLVILLIIAIALMIVVPSYRRAMVFVNQFLAAKSLKTLSEALSMYYNEYGDYPKEAAELTSANPPYVNNRDVILATSRSQEPYGGYYYDYARSGPGRYQYIASPASPQAKNSKQFIITETGELSELSIP